MNFILWSETNKEKTYLNITTHPPHASLIMVHTVSALICNAYNPKQVNFERRRECFVDLSSYCLCLQYTILMYVYCV